MSTEFLVGHQLSFHLTIHCPFFGAKQFQEKLLKTIWPQTCSFLLACCMGFLLAAQSRSTEAERQKLNQNAGCAQTHPK